MSGPTRGNRLSPAEVDDAAPSAPETHRAAARANGDPGRDDTETADERRFRKLVQRSSDITMIVDRERLIGWVSPAAERVLGRSPSDLTGTALERLTHPDDVGWLRTNIDAVEAGASTEESIAARMADASGRWRDMALVAVDLSDDPDVGGLLINARDVSRRVEVERQRQRLTDILETTSDLVGIAVVGGGRVHLNRAGRDFFGLEADAEPTMTDLLANAPSWVRDTWANEVQPVLAKAGQWTGELAAYDTGNRAVPLSVSATAHTDAAGGAEAVSAIARDMSERKAFESRLTHQATHDPLTGLPNRTLLLDRLSVAMHHRQVGSTVAVLFLDLDHFKVVNDSLGHSQGDRVLAEIAQRLSKVLRSQDTVARFGGDEFVILCADLTDAAEAQPVAQRAAAAIARPVHLDDTEVFVTASIGVAAGDSTDSSAEALVRDADAAMYQAKARGRDRTERFDHHLRTQAVDRLSLAGALRRAIDRRELRVLYQPKIDLATGRIIGFEALVRWEHPERGLLMPGEFLGIAEETRLIVPIGHWVARQACTVLAKAQGVIAGGSELACCINLSATQLDHTGLIDDFAGIIAETGLDPGTVDLEITESTLMFDVVASDHTLARLKSLGLLLAVDDFGTGYSSLAYLRRFPVDLLKVDQTFVDGLGTDPSDSAIVAAVVNLAHTLGMRAIAEGVETDLQLRELRHLGCDMAQGFLISRPMGEADLFDLLEQDPRF